MVAVTNSDSDGRDLILRISNVRRHCRLDLLSMVRYPDVVFFGMVVHDPKRAGSEPT